MKKVPRWLGRLLIVIAVIAAGVALYLTVFRPEPIPVTLYRVDRGAVEETVANSKAGTVKARRRARMSPEIGGRVAAIGARPGDEVRQGEELLRINDDDLRASLALARQDVVTAEASAREACLSAEQAGRELARNLDLSAERIV
ncbi:MAG TPA: biotin/lipoyl-binding protein, partial [Candidatus Polarisedimenticolia bacterium]|nr:biotin/lipoyl-binding protein [Candidatus Polarisedimenticolia bacterium]